MTKEEILRIIHQNKDILTPENYQGVLKNTSLFTDDEKLKIARFLWLAKEMMKVNQDFLKAQSALFENSMEEIRQEGQRINRDSMGHFIIEEKKDQDQDKKGDIFANL